MGVLYRRVDTLARRDLIKVGEINNTRDTVETIDKLREELREEFMQLKERIADVIETKLQELDTRLDDLERRVTTLEGR